jgi:hypothetical protein
MRFLLHFYEGYIAVITGATSAPRWACVFNMIPLYLVLAPFRIGGGDNRSSAVMFFALLFLI